MKKAAFFATAFLSAGASAQSVETHAGSESFINFQEEQPTWKVSVGAGAASVPRYEGSSRNKIRFVPLVDADYGHFFLSTARGVGVNFSDDKDLQYGLRLTYARGRKQSDDSRLTGMGDIRGSADVGAFVNARFAPMFVTADLRASSNGSRAIFGAGYDLRFSPADRLRFEGKIDWANTRYMQTYFGVNSVQAANSGLAVYNAGSGVKDYQLSANWMHSYSKEWFSNAGISFKQLNGAAKSSPLTLSPSQNSVNFVVGYRF